MSRPWAARLSVSEPYCSQEMMQTGSLPPHGCMTLDMRHAWSVLAFIRWTGPGGSVKRDLTLGLVRLSPTIHVRISKLPSEALRRSWTSSFRVKTLR